MKVKIAHLYYDLMNLYGEQGNIIALKESLKNQNIETEIDLLSIGDDINFKIWMEIKNVIIEEMERRNLRWQEF